MHQIIQREIDTPKDDSDAVKDAKSTLKVPAIFNDPGYNLLGTSVLSTSNCGNPALRLFGFGPVTPEGYGIGYIIKEEGISICMSSKHLQTRRLLSTLQAYLLEVRGMLIALWKEANEAPEAFMDHAGVMRDARTGKAIVNEDDGEQDEELCTYEKLHFGGTDQQWEALDSSMLAHSKLLPRLGEGHIKLERLYPCRNTRRHVGILDRF
jgi:carnitine O-acetyltransferase